MRKGSHWLSDLKAAYAAARGIPLRTAQDRAKKEHPDWKAFIATMGVKALKSPEPSAPEKQAALALVTQGVPSSGKIDPNIAPECLSKPRELWTPEEHNEAQFWAALVEAHAYRAQASADGDPLKFMNFLKAANSAQASYLRARQARVQADMEAGRLKPMSAWQQAIASIQKMAAVWFSMKSDLAHTVNPSDPAFALKAINDWEQRKWNPTFEGTIKELSLTS